MSGRSNSWPRKPDKQKPKVKGPWPCERPPTPAAANELSLHSLVVATGVIAATNINYRSRIEGRLREHIAQNEGYRTLLASGDIQRYPEDPPFMPPNDLGGGDPPRTSN